MVREANNGLLYEAPGLTQANIVEQVGSGNWKIRQSYFKIRCETCGEQAACEVNARIITEFPRGHMLRGRRPQPQPAGPLCRQTQKIQTNQFEGNL